MTKQLISQETLSRRLLRKTLAGPGVKFALFWIGTLVFCAVFAPFLANSMPLIMSKNGQIFFPVLTYLSIEDLVVLAAFFTILVLWVLPLKLKFRVNLALLAAVIAAVSVLANIYLKPPQIDLCY